MKEQQTELAQVGQREEEWLEVAQGSQPRLLCLFMDVPSSNWGSFVLPDIGAVGAARAGQGGDIWDHTELIDHTN